MFAEVAMFKVNMCLSEDGRAYACVGVRGFIYTRMGICVYLSANDGRLHQSVYTEATARVSPR